MAKSWLQLVVDDLDGVPQTLADLAPTQLRNGSVRIAVWAYVWLSRAHYLLGEWDDATAAAERAVSLLEETGHDWLRPLARWVAVEVYAEQRGVAGRGGTCPPGLCGERRLRADDRGGRPRAVRTWRRCVATTTSVLRALEPLLAIQPRHGVDEPGFWPWQHLYGDALVSLGRLDEAVGVPRSARGAGRRSGSAVRASLGWPGCAGD